MTEEKERELFEAIVEIKCDIKQIRSDLGEDYKILHGNGHPGLIERMTVTETNMRWAKAVAGAIGGVFGFIGAVILKALGVISGQ